MFWGRIHRMILIDLFKVFALSLIALTGLVLLAGVISEAMKSGLGPVQILAAVPLLLPSMLPYTVPATTLFATCIVYGRLAADNEIIALKAAGTHVAHVIWPAALLGILASAATLALYVDVIPYTHFILRSQIGGDVEELVYNVLKKDGALRHPKMKYEVHVKGIEGRTLYGVIFKRHSQDRSGYDLVACATEAVVRVDLTQRQIFVDVKHCQILHGGSHGTIEMRTIPINIPDDWAGRTGKVRSSDMTWAELAFYEAKFRDEKTKLLQDIARHERLIKLGRGKEHYAEHISHQTNELRIRDNYILAIQSERHMRPALALGCICFALIGCPVGIWFCRSDYLSAFVTCFLPVVIVYYPALFCMINMARAGKIAPEHAIYIADAATLLVGLYLLRRLARQ